MDYKELLIQAGRMLLSSNLTVETWGNLSVLDAENGRVYLTPSGMDYETCTAEDIVVLSPDGAVLEGTRRPSVEKALHLAVYRARPEARAVVHTHPVASTVFAVLGEELPLVTDEAAQTLGAPVRVCQYALPGTDALATECVRALGTQANACLLRSHGAVCIGASLKAAFRAARVLEMTAEICWRVRAMGKTPEPIAPEDVRAMQEFMRTGYGQK